MKIYLGKMIQKCFYSCNRHLTIYKPRGIPTECLFLWRSVRIDFIFLLMALLTLYLRDGWYIAMEIKELGKVRLRQAHLIYLSTFLLLLCLPWCPIWFPPSTRSFNCESYKGPIRSSSHSFHQSKRDLWCYIFFSILPQARIEHVSCYFLKVKKLKINNKSRYGLRRTGVLNGEGTFHLIICSELFIPLGGKWPRAHFSLTSKTNKQTTTTKKAKNQIGILSHTKLRPRILSLAYISLGKYICTEFSWSADIFFLDCSFA